MSGGLREKMRSFELERIGPQMAFKLRIATNINSYWNFQAAGWPCKFRASFHSYISQFLKSGAVSLSVCLSTTYWFCFSGDADTNIF